MVGQRGEAVGFTLAPSFTLQLSERSMVVISVLVVCAILFAVFSSGTANERTRLAQRRLARQNPEVDYNYDRFNTKVERRTTVSAEDDRVKLRTDLQRVALTESRLLLEVVSQLELYRFAVDLAVEPFPLEYLTASTAIDDKVLKKLTLTGHGVDSAILIDKVNRLLGYDIELDLASDAVTLKIIAIKRAAGSRQLLCYGLGPNGGEFDLTIDPDSYTLGAEVSLDLVGSLAE